ncbi:MAG TPA: hypothetical protein VEJ68_01320 [Candidatus Bathyarchaeia archaeon]|nr:hypothetical protein [Candidatus Bathyarchaeia archaeon]
MDQKKKKQLNKFALLVILMIAIPEIVGHLYFEGQKHPPTSSIDAALSLTNKQHSMYLNSDSRCHLILKNDTSATNVSRASGVQGQYAIYSCT